MKTGAVLQAALRLSLVATAGSALAPPLVSGWQTTVPGFGFPYETASAVGVAATSDNDVVVVGGLHFIVLKLAATSGQEIWRYDLGDGFTSAVAVDTTGDVIAAGFVQGQARLTVVKLSGPTGSELWRQDVAGTDPFGSSWATDVAVDPMGDVLATGSVENTGTGNDAIVAKLSGNVGTELWRYTSDGGMSGDVMSEVKVDAQGDVIAAGTLVSEPGVSTTSTVVKLAGASGVPVWRKDFPDADAAGFVGSTVATIAANAAGDVAAAGYALQGTGSNLVLRQSVFMLSTVDGSEIWGDDGTPHNITITGFGIPRPRLALHPSGDVVASDPQFAITLRAAADGHELWRQTLGCGSDDFVEALTVDGVGDVVVGGSALGCATRTFFASDFTIAKLPGATGIPIWRRSYDAQVPFGFLANALATTSGDVVASGSIGVTLSRDFSVLGLASDSGALMLCGDGYVDSGEECDDGNVQDGDCCSRACRPAPDGTECFDGNRCTTDDTCKQGSCIGGPPLPCEPCGTCKPDLGCDTSLPFLCRTPTATDKSTLRLESGRSTRHDALLWEWVSGAATKKFEFRDPLTTTGYALCIYGDLGVMLHAEAPAGRTCSRQSGCWRATARGFDYRSRNGNPDGLQRMSLRAGPLGRARITVGGKGRHLELPTLPLETPVTVQLRKLDGSPPCWSATLDLVVRNRTHQFVARGN